VPAAQTVLAAEGRAFRIAVLDAVLDGGRSCRSQPPQTKQEATRFPASRLNRRREIAASIHTCIAIPVPLDFRLQPDATSAQQYPWPTRVAVSGRPTRIYLDHGAKREEQQGRDHTRGDFMGVYLRRPLFGTTPECSPSLERSGVAKGVLTPGLGGPASMGGILGLRLS